jgi:hypothetical protein
MKQAGHESRRSNDAPMLLHVPRALAPSRPLPLREALAVCEALWQGAGGWWSAWRLGNSRGAAALREEALLHLASRGGPKTRAGVC